MDEGYLSLLRLVATFCQLRSVTSRDTNSPQLCTRPHSCGCLRPAPSRFVTLPPDLFSGAYRCFRSFPASGRCFFCDDGARLDPGWAHQYKPMPATNRLVALRCSPFGNGRLSVATILSGLGPGFASEEVCRPCVGPSRVVMERSDQ